MKKIILTLLLIFGLFSFTNANFEKDMIYNFKSSPCLNEIEKIQDTEVKFCEETFLKAYMRRDFSEQENKICADFFARKIESELLYKKGVLLERGVY